MTDAERSLQQLAEGHGVLLSYVDASGQRQEAGVDALLAVLRSLGVALERPEEAPEALRRHRMEVEMRLLDPVVVSWIGQAADVPLRVDGDPGGVRCGVELEDGSFRDLPSASDLPVVGWNEVEGRRIATLRLALPDDLPMGYHTLWAETGGERTECSILRAPPRNWVPEDGGRGWGVFLPLYALRTGRDWGTGDFTDLAALLRWTVARGGRLVGTLPLLATYLSEPCDPSPYAPVSRLFWNEVYVDPTRAPGWGEGGGGAEGGEPAGRPLEFDLRELRGRDLVDWPRVAALKRRALEPLARRFFDGPAEGSEAFNRFLRERPRAEDYARFRATVEARGETWPAWPQQLRDGNLRDEDYDHSAARYHLFAQWIAERQLQELAEVARSGPVADGGSAGLYLDMPLGSHGGGYDTWRERALFAPGVATGAPPDAFFGAGQNWGFPPLHPERIREGSYAYTVDCIRHALRHSSTLRIDHVMGLHRLFWIPDGFPARQGVYVRYRAPELWAILCLESHRQRSTLVGEDLGTVPEEVREAMRWHGVDGMHVLQFEASPDSERALPTTRPGSLATLNTHDMYPFAAWWDGLDVEDRRQLGLLDDRKAAEERKRRAEIRQSLASFLRHQRSLEGAATAATVLRGCLEHLAEGPSRYVIINLEDLWLEARPQNVPGTDRERPNWRRRARLSLEEIRTGGAAELLERIDLAGRAQRTGIKEGSEA